MRNAHWIDSKLYFSMDALPRTLTQAQSAKMPPKSSQDAQNESQGEPKVSKKVPKRR